MSKNVITGTAASLVARGLTLNGQPVKAPYLSVLAGFGLGVTVTGTQKAPEGEKRVGKPANELKLVSRKGLEFAFANAEEVAAAVVEAAPTVEADAPAPTEA